MLPPVDSAITAANPRFDALYRDLCGNRLNEDGTTKLDAKAVKERQVVQEDLHRSQVDTVRRRIVTSAVQDLPYSGKELPDELQDLIRIILDGSVAEEDRDIVLDELERLEDGIPSIATALSKQLQQDVTTLSQLLPVRTLSASTQLPTSIRHLQDDLASSRANLADLRLALAHEVTDLHALYRALIEASIRILEQTIHGSVARGTKAQAEYLALVAEGMSKKLGVQHRQLVNEVYSVEMQEALRAKRSEAEAEGRLIRRKMRDAEERLEQFSRVKGMQGLVREYGEILRETERVRGEIGRLEGRGM